MRIRGVDLHVEEQGSGPPIVFSHGLLWSGRMFEPQVDALKDRFRCIRYDHRGQGRSQMPPQREITIETVYEDAVALIETLGIGPCHFVGLSMGGFVGQRIAVRRPELLRSLVLIGTAADAEPTANVTKYRVLNTIARMGGLRLVASRVLPIMFGSAFLTDASKRDERQAQLEQLLGNRRRIYRAVRGVIGRASFEQQLPSIRTPTLILHGQDDQAIDTDRARRMHRAIAGSTFVSVPRAGHTATVEEPGLVNAELVRFLDSFDPRAANEPRP